MQKVSIFENTSGKYSNNRSPRRQETSLSPRFKPASQRTKNDEKVEVDPLKRKDSLK
jgi:hypothetical protein